MTTGNQVAIVPANMQLPAHLLTAEAAAAIAAYNAAAAGGIKIGGFPRISIKGSKFHIVEGGETHTIMAPTQPGQPPLPLMCLESVVVDANPGLSKVYYAGEYQPGDDREPDCSADNGIVPDSHIANPQSPACATCKQNQWGSKISKTSGKDVKACTDTKRLAILPIADLKYKTLGLAIPPASLGDWGKYVKALSERGIAVNAIVTNITFDATAAFPKLLFSFNRFLTQEEYVAVQERAKGDDVKNITAPVRQIKVPQLPAPAAAPTAPIPAAPPPAQVPPPVAPLAPPAPPVGFGATQAAPVAPAAPAPAPEKPKRAPRKQATLPGVEEDPLVHLPPEVQATIRTLGVNDPIAQALMAKYPKPAPTLVVPPVVVTAVPAPVAAPTGFGGIPAAPQAPATGVGGTSGLSLKDQLAARLRQASPPAAG